MESNQPLIAARRISVSATVAFLGCMQLSGCASHPQVVEPAIEFTKVPPFGTGNAVQLERIEGRVTGALPGQKIVLYAKSGPWWIQPTVEAPFTAIDADSSWKNRTHPGVAYAALLVTDGYRARPKTDTLPTKSNSVLAVAIVTEDESARRSGKMLLFGGYEWQVRQTPNDPGGTHNEYDSSNAWTDDAGSLHLRIAGKPAQWTSAEINLLRSLGYGSYRFVIRSLSHLEPSMVFTMLTYQADGPTREMDVEISKWGESSAARSGQFVIQPYHVPANTVQFQVPDGKVTFMLRWAPGKASFKAFSGAVSRWDSNAFADHAFTSGVPSPGNETIHLNLYIFGSKNPVRQGAEVVVEQFEYLP